MNKVPHFFKYIAVKQRRGYEKEMKKHYPPVRHEDKVRICQGICACVFRFHWLAFHELCHFSLVYHQWAFTVVDYFRFVCIGSQLFFRFLVCLGPLAFRQKGKFVCFVKFVEEFLFLCPSSVHPVPQGFHALVWHVTDGITAIVQVCDARRTGSSTYGE